MEKFQSKYPLYDCSPQARKTIPDANFEIPHTDKEVVLAPNSKYPWGTMKVGQCFVVSMKELSYGSIQSAVYQASARFERKFAIVTHSANQIYEVFRRS